MVAICKRTQSKKGTTDTTLPELPLPYYSLEKGSCCCPRADRILSMEDCNEALEHWSGAIAWKGDVVEVPGGCSFRSQQAPRGHWNDNQEGGQARADMVAICRKPATTTSTTFIVVVHDDLPTLPDPFYHLQNGSWGCAKVDRIQTKAECDTVLGHWDAKVEEEVSSVSVPGGCTLKVGAGASKTNNKGTWNTYQPGGARADMVPVCRGHPLPTHPLDSESAQEEGFPEIDYIWKPEEIGDQTKFNNFKGEAEKYIPGGMTVVRLQHGVNANLWPGSGQYPKVEKWCAELTPNPAHGAVGEKWWRRENYQIGSAAITQDGTTLMPGVIEHIGVSLSHFSTWMDGRSRSLPAMVVAEAGSGPWSSFHQSAGFAEDFKYIVPLVAREAPENWHIVMLDKCKKFVTGGSVKTLWKSDKNKLQHDYNVFKWIGASAGAGLYLVSNRFLQQVPNMTYWNGLGKVDSYLDFLCSGGNGHGLDCYSICSQGAPHWG